MNLLVTGCAGFIGLNFLKYFLEQNHGYNTIYSVDKMGYATKYNKEEYYSVCKKYNIKNLDFNINDISGSLNLDKEKFDILNFASESHVDNSIENPFGIFDENSKIPASCIRIVGGLDYINKFVHISTDEVYSEIEYDDIENIDKWFTPETNIHPNNPYSASKAAQDCFLMSMEHTFGLNLRFIRLANQFGPWQHPEKMMAATCLRVLNGDSVKIYGEGKNVRQWTPVVDSVKVIYDVLVGKIDKPITHISKYDFEGETPVILNNNDVVEVWVQLLEKFGYNNIKKEYIQDRKGHDKAYALRTTEDILSYFDTTLIQRFEETIKFYIKNKEIYNVEQKKQTTERTKKEKS